VIIANPFTTLLTFINLKNLINFNNLSSFTFEFPKLNYSLIRLSGTEDKKSNKKSPFKYFHVMANLFITNLLV